MGDITDKGYIVGGLIAGILTAAGVIIAALINSGAFNSNTTNSNKLNINTIGIRLNPTPIPDPNNYGTIFQTDDPYPVNFNKAKIGMRVSELQSIYPTGRLTSTAFTVKPDSGPFTEITYYHGGNEEDPTIRTIVFDFKEKDREIIYKQAVAAFSSPKITKKVLGYRYEWPKPDEIRANIGETSYNISTKRYRG